MDLEALLLIRDADLAELGLPMGARLKLLARTAAMAEVDDRLGRAWEGLGKR